MRNILLFIIFMCVGCTPYAAYTAFQPVDNEQWGSTDSVKFEICVPTSSNPHTLHICVRTTETHPFDSIYLPLEITQVWDAADTSRIDTLSIALFDPTGNKNGKGINHRDIRAELCTLEPTDTLKGFISIRPCLPHPVHGISHVGVEIR